MIDGPLVLDSCVFAKSFLQEPDRHYAVELLDYASEQSVPLLCPDIFVYEVLSIASRHGHSLRDIMEFIKDLENSDLRIKTLTANQLDQAIGIAEDGHPNSGYPSIYDSAYHALALSTQGVFITADRRHFTKAEKYGGILMLSDWEQLKG